MPNNSNNRDSSPLSQISSTAGAVKGAIKAGKTISGATKGAALGPYGMITGGLWENRKLIGKILAAAAFLFLLPVLYIMMLPTLIFGNDGLDAAPGDVLNNTTVITQNIAETEAAISDILMDVHNEILSDIQKEADNLGDDCDYSISDPFADRIIYESSLVISQFCASENDYQEINLSKLKKILKKNAKKLFSYSVSTSTYEKTDEKTKKKVTITHYTYTVHYAGSEYFADTVFALSANQKATALEYAANLHLFLYDMVYQVQVNHSLVPGQTGLDAVELALTKLGTPYSQELRDQEGYFDCSSFTYWVYTQLGIALQADGVNTAAAQGRYIVQNDLAISVDNLAPGDLIFYSFETNNRYMNISHVAIYAGDGNVIDASSTSIEVVYRPIYNTDRIMLCGRPYINQ